MSKNDIEDSKSESSSDEETNNHDNGHSAQDHVNGHADDAGQVMIDVFGLLSKNERVVKCIVFVLKYNLDESKTEVLF